MIKRRLQAKIKKSLDANPAVAILGPRQVGKTTLALEITKRRPSIYLDLQSDSDKAKLKEPELYLSEHKEKLVVFDEVQASPNLFSTLRGLIDQGRREKKVNNRFLILGSASLDLLRQSSESLAGRISYIELTPLQASEVPHIERLWLRGGFPNSYLAKSEARSAQWRLDFIKTYLERDIPQLGPRISAETLKRFWTMLAHRQMTTINISEIASSLGIDGKTANKYLDLMVDLLLVRKLPPWHGNLNKRLVKSPKIYVRDSGLCHSLLGISNKEGLFSHPVSGMSWESFVIENIINSAPPGTLAFFFRTAAGAEIDLVLELPNNELIAIEVKRSLSPKLERGFYNAVEDLKPTRQFLVYPGKETYPFSEEIKALPLISLCKILELYK